METGGALGDAVKLAANGEKAAVRGANPAYREEFFGPVALLFRVGWRNRQETSGSVSALIKGAIKMN